ncbi:MAG: hypothetical protein IPJ94_16725 [Chloroflexi bacterium]|nr:hypothetical protein [Chloroflexota bacterium]
MVWRRALQNHRHDHPLTAQLHHQFAKHEEAVGRFAEAQIAAAGLLAGLEAPDLVPYAAEAWEMLGRAQLIWVI